MQSPLQLTRKHLNKCDLYNLNSHYRQISGNFFAAEFENKKDVVNAIDKLVIDIKKAVANYKGDKSKISDLFKQALVERKYKNCMINLNLW